MTTAVDSAPNPFQMLMRQAPVFFRRIPATLSMIALIVAIGLIFGTFWNPLVDQTELFNTVAYGLPALQQGLWWTPITGTFFAITPWAYLITILAFWGMAYLEYKRGSGVALLYYWGGQLFAVLVSALLLWSLASLFPGFAWAQLEATMRDVGASGGTMATIAAAVGLFVSPWRSRAWIALLAFVTIALVFWGSLDDLEHFLAVILILVVDRSMRVRNNTAREKRLIAWVFLVFIGIFQLIVLFIPTAGIFGATEPWAGSWVDLTIDVVVIALLVRALQLGRFWGWLLALILSAVNIFTSFLVALIVLVAGRHTAVDILGGAPELSIATGLLWLTLLVYLIMTRSSFRSHRHSRLGIGDAPSREEVKEMLAKHGGTTLSWMTTWDGMEYARTTHGFVGYQKHNKVALALADPVGPEGTLEQSVSEFVASAEAAGLVPCFFSSSEQVLGAVDSRWRNIIVADDSIVDVADLSFTGKKWGAVRTSINRAGRDEMRFVMTKYQDLSWGLQQQLRAISDSWVGDKGLPEMGFTLGTLHEADDDQVLIALAISPDGNVDGFLSWLPVFGGDGKVKAWTLDLMRRRENGFGPVMEFLIGSSLQYFQEQGAEFVSLSGAPLSHDYPEDAGAIAGLSKWLGDTLEPVYGFSSLHRFKQKFNPRYETMYLVYRDEGDMPRIAVALTKAFLPDASIGQLAAAGLEVLKA